MRLGLTSSMAIISLCGWPKLIIDYLNMKKPSKHLLGEMSVGMRKVDSEELDTQALEAIRLWLSNEVSYDMINEKITMGLIDKTHPRFHLEIRGSP